MARRTLRELADAIEDGARAELAESESGRALIAAAAPEWPGVDELDELEQRQADAAERRKNGQPGRGPAGPRPRVKGSRKHCSTHAEYRSDCYRCQMEGCF